MTEAIHVSPGLRVCGTALPVPLGTFKLLVFGMDSALLYPGAEALSDACANAGMVVNRRIGETSDGLEKQTLLLEACKTLHIQPASAVVVGRAASDLPMMKLAGLAVAFMASAEVAAAAQVVVSSGGLDRVLGIVSLPTPLGLAELDLSVLDAMVNHDEAKFRKFALLFMDSVEEVLKTVDGAIASAHLPTLMAMGHRAKSTAKNVGAEKFSDCCLRMEQAARAEDLPGTLRLAQSLRPQFEVICSAIMQRLGRSA